MTDRSDFTEPFLSDDLRALDEELSSIRYEERPSFGPELRAQLAKAWAAPPPRRTTVFRHLAAAALTGILVVGAAVPSARASFVRMFSGLNADEAVVPEPARPIPPRPATPPPLTVDEVVEPVVAVIAPIIVAPIATSGLLDVQPPVPPRMVDRAYAVELFQQAYPPYLQHDGVGGLVRVRVWVDANGVAGLANVSRGSGIGALDRAALEAAPLLRFEPAMQNGKPVGTWIEFPVLFEPEGPEVDASGAPTDDPLRLPTLEPDAQWEFDDPLDPRTLPEWDGVESESATATEAALVDAIGDAVSPLALGPVDAILTGIAPQGHAPTAWRAAASAILGEALARDPANPAPLLALGRIRLRQGLRTDARMLFERGLEIAIENGTAVSPALLAELHHERGMLIRESWRAADGVGRVRAQAFDLARCAQARSTGGAESGFASMDRLIAWNYLCPAELEGVFEIGFEASGDGVADLSLTMASFRAALEADPGHVGANVALLLALADVGRWEDVLAGARRFARRADGHPRALLLGGLALQRLGRSAEARAYFEVALERLPSTEADEVRDVTFVIDQDQIGEYRRLWGAERQAWETEFWATRDRTPETDVNEREVEHLARSAYAHLRFGGPASDAGEVWVRFGGPDNVHIVDEGSGQLTEFWDYGSSGPDITFVRWVASQTMDLTPEGRAYVDDLGKIFLPQ